MVIYYDRLYLKKGIRRIQHIDTPRILDANEFIFPVNSAFHWWKVSEDVEYFTNEYGYLKNTSKALVESITDYTIEDLKGKMTNRAVLINSVIAENAKKCKTYKFLKPKQEIKITDKVLKVYNYGYINAKHKYQTQRFRDYNIYYNTFASVINNLFIDPTRYIFLLLDMPTSLPDRILLNKAAENLRISHLDILKTYKHLIVLDLWRFLTPELKHFSIFSFIPKEKYDKVNLLFSLDNKLMLFNLNMLASCVKEYDIATNMQPKPAVAFRKRFYNMLHKFITDVAMSEQELENLEIKIDTANNNNTDNDNTSSSSDTKDADHKDDNSNMSMFRRITTSRVKQQEKVEEVDKAIKSDISIRDEDIIEDELDDDLPDELDDKLDINVNINIPTVDVSDDINEIDDVADDETSNLELMQLENEVENTIDTEYKSLDSLLNEEYNFDVISNKINYLKENKVLSKKDAENLTESIEKSLNSKDPYGSNNKVKDILSDKTDDTTLNKEECAITPNKVVFDNRLNNNIVNTVRKEYIEKQYKKDIVRSVFSIQNGNAIVSEYTITPKDNIVGSVEEHRITIKTLDNKTHSICVVLPKITPNGEILYGNNTYIMRFQRAAIPINKISATEVKLSSYYGNIFVSKATYKKDDAGYYIMNKLAKRYINNEDIENLVMLPSNNKDVRLPIDYALFSRYIKSFKYKDYTFNFEYNKRQDFVKNLSNDELEKIESNDVVLIGSKGNTPVVMDYHNRLFIYKDKKYTEIDNLYDLLNIDRLDEPIEHSIVRIYKKYIPTVILLSYYIGLYNLMKLLKIKYEIITDNSRIPMSTEYFVIKFKDARLKIYRDYAEGDMILGGLIYIEDTLSVVSIKTMNSKNDFSVLFNKLDYKVIHINEIKMLETLFVDPMTLNILKELKLPTAFKGLLIKANEMLVDDNYQNPNNINGSVIKGYERVAGLLYKELISSLKEHENKSAFSKARITINPYVILNKINEDSTTVLVDNLNPIAAIKQTEDVSFLGAGGFNKETLARDSRILNTSEIGVISEAAKDNGDVGITAYLSATPKIKTSRGVVDKFDIKKDGWGSILSTSGLLMPFSTTDDTKRLNFSSIHNGHVVHINDMKVPHVRTGYEAIIPIRAGSRFVIVAEDDGVVTKVTKSEITVKYDKLGSKSYRIKDWTTKEEAEACYTHIMVPNLNVNDKFIKDDTLVYDSLFFEPDIFNPKRVVYRQGGEVTVALVENPETYEDSAGISKRLNTRLGTTVTKIKSVTLANTDEVINLKKVGDKVTPNDILFSIIDTGLTKLQLDSKTLDILKNLNTKSPKAKMKGTISKIVLKYNTDITNLSESLKEIAEMSDKQLKQDTGFTGNVVGMGYSIRGVPLLENQVELKIYINTDSDMGIGDKAILSNQLKFTVGEVYENDITAEDGTPIDLTFSLRSISARIVLSPLLNGTTSMVLDRLEKKAIETYFGKTEK